MQLNWFFSSGTTIEDQLGILISDTGGGFVRWRRDDSHPLDLFYCFPVRHSRLMFLLHLPDHHCTKSLVLGMVVGDLLTSTSPSRPSSLHMSTSLAAGNGLCSDLRLARPPKSKSFSMLDPELILTHAASAEESSSVASLVGHQPYRISKTLDLMVKMEAKGVKLTYKAPPLRLTHILSSGESPPLTP